MKKYVNSKNILLILSSLLVTLQVESSVAMESIPINITNYEINNDIGMSIPNTLHSSSLEVWGLLINTDQNTDVINKFVSLLIDTSYNTGAVYSVDFITSLNEYTDGDFNLLTNILKNHSIVSALQNISKEYPLDSSVLCQQLRRFCKLTDSKRNLLVNSTSFMNQKAMMNKNTDLTFYEKNKGIFNTIFQKMNDVIQEINNALQKTQKLQQKNNIKLEINDNTLNAEKIINFSNRILINQRSSDIEKAIEDFLDLLTCPIIEEKSGITKLIYSTDFLKNLIKYDEKIISTLINILKYKEVKKKLAKFNGKFEANILYYQLARASWHCNHCKENYLISLIDACLQNKNYSANYFLPLSEYEKQVINVQLLTLHEKNYKLNLSKQALEKMYKIVCHKDYNALCDLMSKNGQKINPDLYYHIIMNDRMHTIEKQINNNTIVTRFLNLSLSYKKNKILFRDTFFNNLINYYDVNDLNFISNILRDPITQDELSSVRKKSINIFQDLNKQINEIQKQNKFDNEYKELLNEIVELIAIPQQNDTNLEDLTTDNIQLDNEITKQTQEFAKFILTLENSDLLANYFLDNNNKEGYYKFINLLQNEYIKKILQIRNVNVIIQNLLRIFSALETNNNIFADKSIQKDILQKLKSINNEQDIKQVKNNNISSGTNNSSCKYKSFKQFYDSIKKKVNTASDKEEYQNNIINFMGVIADPELLEEFLINNNNEEECNSFIELLESETKYICKIANNKKYELRTKLINTFKLNNEFDMETILLNILYVFDKLPDGNVYKLNQSTIVSILTQQDDK